MDLSLGDFHNLRDLVYERSGIFFEDKKIYFLKKRMENRIQQLGLNSPTDYYRYIKYSSGNGEAMKFIELLTTNETYFFREIQQLNAFSEEALPMLEAEKRQANNYTLNVWSAGCSTGEEPYTLAILLRERLKDIARWRVNIYGSDINNTVLESALHGHYSPRSVKDVPPEYLAKYFYKEGGDYCVTDEMKGMITFKQVNLVDRNQMRGFRNIDFLFCRNVLIYFDDNSRKTVVNYFYDSMTKGGFIFLGHSESVGRISAAFKLVRLKNALVYRK